MDSKNVKELSMDGLDKVSGGLSGQMSLAAHYKTAYDAKQFTDRGPF